MDSRLFSGWVMAGYSQKPLSEKLGVSGPRKSAAKWAAGDPPILRALFVEAPSDYPETLGPLPPHVSGKAVGLTKAVSLATKKKGQSGLGAAPFGFIQVFCRTESELALVISALKRLLASDGMLWISWPKLLKGRKPGHGDLNETRVRAIGLASGLVDVKVCAIDGTWSGLKFVFRLEDRP